MNGRHTSGRIAAIVPPSSCFTTRFLVADTGEHIAKVAHMDYSAGDVFTDVGNAERLAACWNLCEGFSTDELKSKADAIREAIGIVLCGKGPVGEARGT